MNTVALKYSLLSELGRIAFERRSIYIIIFYYFFLTNIAIVFVYLWFKADMILRADDERPERKWKKKKIGKRCKFYKTCFETKGNRNSFWFWFSLENGLAFLLLFILCTYFLKIWYFTAHSDKQPPAIYMRGVCNINLELGVGASGSFRPFQ